MTNTFMNYPSYSPVMSKNEFRPGRIDRKADIHGENPEKSIDTCTEKCYITCAALKGPK